MESKQVKFEKAFIHVVLTPVDNQWYANKEKFW
jgi:hypothetical protein